MTLELGAYSFGVSGRDSEGNVVTTAQAVRNVLEQIRLAEQVGLDFFGVGEHHHEQVPVSSPTALLSAAAAMTSKITLSTAVSVLSTDDPIRLYQQAATAAIVSNDRVELIVGRGSSTESFPLFGYDLADYDRRDHDPRHRHRPPPRSSGCERCRETALNCALNSDNGYLQRTGERKSAYLT